MSASGWRAWSRRFVGGCTCYKLSSSSRMGATHSKLKCSVSWLRDSLRVITLPPMYSLRTSESPMGAIRLTLMVGLPTSTEPKALMGSSRCCDSRMMIESVAAASPCRKSMMVVGGGCCRVFSRLVFSLRCRCSRRRAYGCHRGRTSMLPMGDGTHIPTERRL